MLLYAVVATGVAAVSCAAVLIRLADAPALAIAAYRLSVAGLVVAPLAVSRDWSGLRSLTFSQATWCVASALALAVHFAAWIASLEHTSVASSVVLVTTSPLLIAAVSYVAYRERLTAPVAGGIALGLAGSLTLALGDRAAGDRELFGDLLALIGAVGAAAYFLIGRRVRRQMSNVSYIGIVYPACAITLLAAAAVTGTPMTGYDSFTVAMIVTDRAGASAAGPLVAQLGAGSPERDDGGRGRHGGAGGRDAAGVAGARRGAAGRKRRGRRAGADGRVPGVSQAGRVVGRPVTGGDVGSHCLPVRFEIPESHQSRALPLRP